MTELEGCIRHWEQVLFYDRYLLSPAVQAIIELTIKYLKKAKE